MLHRSSPGREFWWNQLPCGPVLTPISCTKLKIHSAHADSPIVHKSVVFICYAGNLDVGLVYASQIKKLRKRCLSGTSSLVGRFLHPSPVQNSRSIWQTVQLFLKSVVFTYAGNLDVGLVYASQTKKFRKKCLGATSFLVCQFLHPSPVQSPRSIQHTLTVQLYLNKCVYSPCAVNLDELPVYVSQIKLRKRILVEPAPLWASSYTHVLYKAQDPFDACRWFYCS